MSTLEEMVAGLMPELTAEQWKEYLGLVADRLRYLASSVPAEELDHELHALARSIETIIGK